VLEPGAFERHRQGKVGSAVLVRRAVAAQKHEVVVAGAGGKPALSQWGGEVGGDRDGTTAALGLDVAALALAVELPLDAEGAPRHVHVGPGQPEHCALAGPALSVALGLGGGQGFAGGGDAAHDHAPALAARGVAVLRRSAVRRPKRHRMATTPASRGREDSGRAPARVGCAVQRSAFGLGTAASQSRTAAGRVE
jgi:hypothetical protein